MDLNLKKVLGKRKLQNEKEIIIIDTQKSIRKTELKIISVIDLLINALEKENLIIYNSILLFDEFNKKELLDSAQNIDNLLDKVINLLDESIKFQTQLEKFKRHTRDVLQSMQSRHSLQIIKTFKVNKTKNEELYKTIKTSQNMNELLQVFEELRNFNKTNNQFFKDLSDVVNIL